MRIGVLGLYPLTKSLEEEQAGVRCRWKIRETPAIVYCSRNIMANVAHQPARTRTTIGRIYLREKGSSMEEWIGGFWSRAK